MTTQVNDMAKVAELLKGFRFCMFTTVEPGGKLVARPMSIQESEFDGDLWFIAERNSGEVAQIGGDSSVGLTFSSNDTWMSLSGTAEQVDDDAKLKELWNPWVQSWFPNGPEDPNATLIRFTADSAEYWDTPGGRVVSLLNFVKSKVTGDTYDGGETGKVDL